MPKEKVKPVHEIRLGRIKAAVWQNQTQNGSRYNVTLSRLYRDGTRWKDSTSFGRDDLLVVAKIAEQAFAWIYQQSQGQNGSQNREQNDSSREAS
jgi:hypothetical protein